MTHLHLKNVGMSHFYYSYRSGIPVTATSRPTIFELNQVAMLYLGGGGSGHDESKIWDMVFQPGQRIAVWPQAQPQAIHSDVLNWFTNSLAPRGHFEILESSKAAPQFGLDTADVLFIPGGNTFHLLDFMQKHDLLNAVHRFLAQGGHIFGGSAGAVILGVDIEICDVKNGGLDENDIGLEDTRLLGFLVGAWCIRTFRALIRSNMVFASAGLTCTGTMSLQLRSSAGWLFPMTELLSTLALQICMRIVRGGGFVGMEREKDGI